MNMKKLAALLVLASASWVAHAEVVIQNLSATATNISFDIVGTINKTGAGFLHQFGFGHVSDPSLDWINSFNAGSSSVSVSGPTKQGITSVYDLTGMYGETIWTVSSAGWQVGDQIALHYDLIGDFNLANFNASGLGLQVGWSGSPGVESANNILAISEVPEPGSLALLSLCLAGLAAARRRKPA